MLRDGSPTAAAAADSNMSTGEGVAVTLCSQGGSGEEQDLRFICCPASSLLVYPEDIKWSGVEQDQGSSAGKSHIVLLPTSVIRAYKKFSTTIHLC